MIELIATTVEDVLTRSPHAAGVFLGHRMACMGCTMAPFDTVADAADAYGLDPHRFADELVEAIRSDPPASPEDAPR